MSVRPGPVTLLSVVEGKDGIFLLVAEGESGGRKKRCKSAIRTAVIVFRSVPAPLWMHGPKRGPAHHCAIGIGHVADKIEKLGFILGLPVVKVC